MRKIKLATIFLLGLCCWGSVIAGIHEEVLTNLAQSQGFFFFYSASCPHCQSFAPRLREFSERYGFSVVAISVDGGYLSDFPDAVMNQDQAKIFQVAMFPSLFLVDPEHQIASLIAEGNIDEQALKMRILKINTMQGKALS